ncbi:hypothetical protein F511_39987 [Dorcoceras hygrometricum]|uniref:Uncharacterized protein n=1 Tax=Dorcoceras hygrometricum TaxID=472368 RepID=A0A2Z7BWN8_9LAMI|nr:hypothetical protein F511_39987 [Dorcoceras hygrometricum]
MGSSFDSYQKLFSLYSSFLSPPPPAAAVAALFAGNSFRPIRRGESIRVDLVSLLVQADEGVSHPVVDLIGVIYRSLP